MVNYLLTNKSMIKKKKKRETRKTPTDTFVPEEEAVLRRA